MPDMPEECTLPTITTAKNNSRVISTGEMLRLFRQRHRVQLQINVIIPSREFFLISDAPFDLSLLIALIQ